MIKGWKELFEKINEHVTSLGVMRHSPYYSVFEKDASEWEDKLTRMSTMFDVWVTVQRRYVYLEVPLSRYLFLLTSQGIFTGSEEIKQLLQKEYLAFKQIDSEFVNIMRRVCGVLFVVCRFPNAVMSIMFDFRIRMIDQLCNLSICNFLSIVMDIRCSSHSL